MIRIVTSVTLAPDEHAPERLKQRVFRTVEAIMRAERQLTLRAYVLATHPGPQFVTLHQGDEDTEQFSCLVRRFAGAGRATFAAVASEAWLVERLLDDAAADNWVRNYRYGDVHKHPQRREIVSVGIESPSFDPANQCYFAPIIRNQGRPKLGEWTRPAARNEGRFGDLLPPECYGTVPPCRS